MSLGATKYIGARIARREDVRFLTGRTRYVDDIRLPRTVHAAFVRSPYAHAEVQAMRTERAARLGVCRAPDGRGGYTAHPTDPRRLGMAGVEGTDFPVLAWPRVHFVGQAVAVVAAVDRYVAEDAAELVEVDYHPLPVVVDLEAAAEPVALWCTRPGAITSSLIGREVWGRRWRLRASRSRLAAHLSHPPAHGVSHGGPACIADYDPATRRPDAVLRHADAAPAAYRTRRHAWPRRTRHPGHRARCRRRLRHQVPPVPEEVAVCLLSIRLGRPVKWIEDTTEHLAASIHAREHVHRVQVAVKRDGTSSASRRMSWSMPAHTRSGPGRPRWKSAWREYDSGAIPYRAYEFRARTVATNKCPLGPYRGVARSSAAFTIERARWMRSPRSWDSTRWRSGSRTTSRTMPTRTRSVTGFIYDSASLQASLQKLTEVIGYDDFRREQAAARAQGRYLGLGIGTFIEQTAHGTSEFVRRRNPIVFGYDTVSVSLDPSGKVTVASGLHSHGQGHETTLAQVVAERLGVPLPMSGCASATPSPPLWAGHLRQPQRGVWRGRGLESGGQGAAQPAHDGRPHDGGQSRRSGDRRGRHPGEGQPAVRG